MKGRIITVGRESGNDIILDFPQVSGYHARFIFDSGACVVEDLGSTNGTFVNGRRVNRATVGVNDEVSFGSFRFNMENIFNERILADLMKISSTAKSSSTEEKRIRLDTSRRELVLGRNPRADIALSSPRISWEHAKITRIAPERFIIEDLGSTNGTFVNGRRIKKKEITASDRISLGSFEVTLDPSGEVARKDIRGKFRIDSSSLTVEVKDHTDPKVRKRILDGVSLSIMPGELVAIMGPAGSGKTTLIMTMCGYLKPSDGESLVNGMSIHKAYDFFRGHIGYVPQDDIVHKELTVFESIYYSAKIKLPSDMSDDEVVSLCNDIISTMNLEGERDKIIGSIEKKVLSGGQRKRVNIAHELITDPDILFLDEPTTGLSSFDAVEVGVVLKKLSGRGKTVIAVIHQPSTELIRQFDKVIVLAKGGKLAFFGRPEPDAVNFFSGITQSTFREGANPAEFFLAALEKREPAAFEEGYGRSEYRKREIEEKASDLRKIQIDTIPPKTPRKFAWRQFTTATKRYLKIKVRDTSNTLILLLQAPIIGLLQYLVFEEKSPALMFMLIVSAIWFGCSNASREIVSEQAIFKRERMVNLTLPAYIFSKILVLFLLCVLQCTILLSIVFSKVDFDENFWRIDALMILVSFSSLCMGLFISSLVKSTDAAVALIPIVLIPQVLFAGLVIPVGKMPSAAKPFTYFMISRYGFEGFAEFENCAVISEMTKVKTLFKCREIIGFTGQDMVPITDIFLILLTVGLIFIFSSMVLLRWRDLY